MQDLVPEDTYKLKAHETYKGSAKVKRAGVQIPYTQEQIEEIVRCKDDLLHFVRNHVKIINVDHGLVPFEYYDYQADMMERYKNNRFVIALTARQMGKCLQYDTEIKVRNKRTGEEKEISIGEFFEQQLS